MSAAVIAAGAVHAARRRVTQILRDAGALSPETAAPVQLTRGLDRGAFERLLRAGAVREAAPGLYWLDEAALELDDRRRRRRASIATAVMMAVMAVIALFLLARLHASG